MHFLSDFFDQAVVLPLTFAVALALALGGWRRGAAAWLVCIAATLAAVLLGKLLVCACGPPLPLSLRSPSGHTAAAAVACGGLLALLAPPGRRALLLAVAGAAAAAALIGATRLALGVHSGSDVLVGGAVGIAGAAGLSQLAGARPPGLRRVLPVGAALATMVVFHGVHLHAEDGILGICHAFWR